MADPPDRRGLNEAEAAVARTIVETGASPDLLDGLEPGAARALRPLVEEIADAPAERRESVASEWSDLDARLDRRPADDLEARGPRAAAIRSWRSDGESFPWIESARMKRALAAAVESELPPPDVCDERLSEDPYHFDAVVRMKPEAFETFAADLGVYQVAEVVRGHNRRRIARLSRQFSGRRRTLFAEALAEKREMDRSEQSRLREVFVTLSRHFDSFPDRVRQAGLYTVACAASRRFRERLRRIRRRVDDETSRRLARYYRLCRGSSRRRTSEAMRESVERCLRWREEAEPTDDSDDLD